MKKICAISSFFLCLFFCNKSVAQKAGFILLNEYMPWATNSCSTSSEFVELYNFGPGPVNIGCYTITDGDYSVTIPPNTIVNPGNFFVISGMDSIPQGCANIDSPTIVNLNWNTCNCTSGPIPSTGGGWLTDGGSANEQVVFLDPNFKVVDAVVRNLPNETSSAITTSSLSGGCTAKTFDLDTMNITYETIGQSAGRGNSFAREVNGDCVWVKDPQQSAGATNNRSTTATSSLATVLNVTKANACSNNGSVSVTFPGTSDYTTIFPANYILAKDVDSNNVYDLSDTYINGTDSISPAVEITGLSSGSYNLAIEPKSGCNYQFYSFKILPCSTLILDHSKFLFRITRRENYAQLFWSAQKLENVSGFEIEKSVDGISFQKIQTVNVTSSFTEMYSYNDYNNKSLGNVFYRIKIIYNNGIAYSAIEKLSGTAINDEVILFPNPVHNILTLNLNTKTSQLLSITISASDGKMIAAQKACTHPGSNTIRIETNLKNRGLYFVSISKPDGSSTVQRVYKD